MADNSQDLVVNGKKWKFDSTVNLGNVLVLATLIFGMATSWMTLSNALATNHSTMQQILANDKEHSDTIEKISRHQLNNEFLIDQHSSELEEIEKVLHLRVAVHKVAASPPQP